MEKILKLKNKSKLPTVFEIRKLTHPEGAVFTPMLARIPPEITFEILCSYDNQKDMLHPYKKNFFIDVVGMEPLEIPFMV